MNKDYFLGGPEDEMEFMPIIPLTEDGSENNDDQPIPVELPLLPLRNTVLFPGVVIPITVGRDKSIKLIRDANKGKRMIGVVAQQDVAIEDPTFSQLNSVGTIALIIKMLQMPDGNTTVILQGKKRFILKEEVQSVPYIKATIEPFKEIKHKDDKEFKAMVSSIKDMAMNIIQLSPNIPSEAGIAIRNIESTSFLINFISSNMNADMIAKQHLLEEPNLRNRANLVLEHLTLDLQMLELKNQIQSKVRVDLDKQQRDYFLNQQLKTIHEELGGNSPDLEIESLKMRASKKKWGKDVAAHFGKELEKLARTN